MILKVSVIGATGYAGAELLAILKRHPGAETAHITSESHTGKRIDEIYPHLRGIYESTLESLENLRDIATDSDFLFIALPHGHAMKVGREVADLPTRIIDLGADYRFDDTAMDSISQMQSWRCRNSREFTTGKRLPPKTKRSLNAHCR